MQNNSIFKNNKSLVLTEDDRSAIDIRNILDVSYPNLKITYFPAKDSMPFSSEVSSPEILLDRSEKLLSLPSKDIVIITCNNLIQKFSLNNEVQKFIKIQVNQKVDLKKLTNDLVKFGHTNQSNVYNKLEFSLRGDILDIYNYQTNPIRVSFFDDVVETIKEFNPQTQLTFKNNIDEVLIVNPFIETDQVEPQSLISLLSNFNLYSVNRADLILNEKIEFLKSIYNQSNIEIPFTNFYLDKADIEQLSYEKLRFESANTILKHNNFTLDELSNLQFNIYIHHGENISSFSNEFNEKIKTKPTFGGNIHFLNSKISKNYFFDQSIHINNYSKSTNSITKSNIVNFNELSLGDPIVHQKHGIGRFISIDSLTVSNKLREFVRLVYRGNDKLLLPIENLNLITRYGFDDSNLLLDKLGSTDWINRKANVKKKIKFIANKLLKNAAKRSSIHIAPFEFNETDLVKFNELFSFIETEDQLLAIDQSLEDLKNDKPANRLICGDVGFGKTEVALRIACATYLSGFQFVIIVPTTLLAMQHTNTFKERFNFMNVKVATLSRFTSIKEKKEILLSLKSGDIQILISTHSLFKKDIEFNNLGTLVIDEEQKFGVDQKEYLINKYPNIHLFSLSATPIPRTLQMSLLGLKDLSIIGTPPSNRISIRTYVQKYEPVTFLSAVKNEILRKGQVFIVVPRISHIPFVESEIKKLSLDVTYAIGHSKMKEKEIEDVFISFTKGQIQCLISTNIIESGIDIKNANTLIVFNSNLFGLSQLYQLRGRVGRSDKRAYAYLFHDNEKLINKTALKKLQVLANYENLGSNFQLANEDLEIRGAGNLLGDEQSGHVKEIGIELYQSMLKAEIERLNKNSSEDEQFDDFEFNAYFEYYIPKDYIADDISRLIFYRKLTNAKNNIQLKDILYEMNDRYGNYPIEINNLFNLLTIKIKSIKIGVIKINIQKNYIDLTFKTVNENTSSILIQMVQENLIKMKSPLTIQMKNIENKDLFFTINLFFKKLGL